MGVFEALFFFPDFCPELLFHIRLDFRQRRRRCDALPIFDDEGLQLFCRAVLEIPLLPDAKQSLG